MHVVVVQRMVPDVVEELELAPDGLSLLEERVRYIVNELDEHALEQALLLKQRHQARVTVIVVGESANETLATALAKGADEVVKLVTDFGRWRDNHRLAALLYSVLKKMEFDLVLTGVQAIDDLDGCLGGLLASHMGLPYCGSLAGLRVEQDSGIVIVEKEYPGGVLGVMEVDLPAVLGIQSAENPPRYVPVSRVRLALRSMTPSELAETPQGQPGVSIVKLMKPEERKAEIIAGAPEEVADRIVSLLKERGIV